ncbi:U3 small nucleolar ribonucleo protein subunit [Aspergillus ellipticus CBS 707.79]|uniref:U3 small nucleolar ribonucleoprotein protein IMP3 n=1 Tax=Aspergillus ellipticus CBS 707.79 TaxID=1448320 RepID=A0A319DEB6_9EURO|nr:U3 small nucleolar ribonucleo protein subunit [Aspergillus ellipticus CBS 707.79]
MVRTLKHHEKKLLRKVDFHTYKSDNNHRESTIRTRYHLQDPLDYRKYNQLCGSLRQLAHKLSELDPETDAVRKTLESDMLDKLWRMGILKQSREQGAGLSRVEREVTVSAFCRRRLAVFMARSGMVENITTAATFIEQGHVRVGTEVVTDPAYLVTRNMEDFVTWVDSSKIKRTIMRYRDNLDDFDML